MSATSYPFRGLILLPERAVFEPQSRTLFIADPHFGKASSFRALGQPVPRGTTAENLRRLGALADAHDARRLVVLGDFLHSRTGRTQSLFARLREWRAARPALDCVVVRGNHDVRSRRRAGRLRLYERRRTLRARRRRRLAPRRGASRRRGAGHSLRSHPSGRAACRSGAGPSSASLLLSSRPGDRPAGLRRIHGRPCGRFAPLARTGGDDRNASLPDPRRPADFATRRAGAKKRQ